MKRLILALLVCILIMGCGSMLAAGRERRAYWQQEASRPVICNSGKDCEVMWGKCLQWVQANSRWKLRTVNDFIITTEGPFNTYDPAFSITKRPNQDGTYSIDFNGGCGNLGCSPALLYFNARFVNFVNGTPFIER